MEPDEATISSESFHPWWGALMPVDEPTPNRQLVRFGVFELDLKAGDLRRGGVRIKLQEQPFQILQLLLRRGGDVVTHDEIIHLLWPHGTIVEYEHSVKTAVKKLRQALGDDADVPRYVETLPRRGYRFIYPVEVIASPPVAVPIVEPVSPEVPAAWEPPSLAAPSAEGTEETSSGLAGQTVSHYRVLDRIGSGAMGVIYRAEDTRLDRMVALKFLPAELAQDPQALARFQREARAASALNHPNICTVYDIDEHAGQPFIAMELLEGETLKERLAVASISDRQIGGRRPPLQLDTLLDLASQIAAGLEAAHGKGIIHRDIKPANIFLTAQGQAKILDFGVAKLTRRTGIMPVVGSDPEQGDRAAAGPTRTTDDTLTQPGSPIGTATYMSPEQIRGEVLDTRTDIFSFGAVLYEMATGRQAFPGGTSSEVQQAILMQPPVSPKGLYPDLPAKLDEIINKALEKDRETRYQTASDLRADLKRLKQDADSGRSGAAATLGVYPEEPGGRGSPGTPLLQRGDLVPAAVTHDKGLSSDFQMVWSMMRQHKTAVTVMPLVLAIIVLALGYSLYKLTRKEAKPATAGTSFESLQITRLTSNGKSRLAAISPDGKYVVYSVEDAGKQSLWLRQVVTTSNVQIIPPADIIYLGLTFSLDGNYIYYVQTLKGAETGSLYQAPVLGGALQKLFDNVDSPVALSPDGKRLTFERGDPSKVESSILTANLDGSGLKVLSTTKLPEYYVGGVAWSPDGKTVAFARGEIAHHVLRTVPSAGGGERVLSTSDWDHMDSIMWRSDGSGLIFNGSLPFTYWSRQLWELSYPAGELRRITNDLNSYHGVSLTGDSHALVTVKEDTSSGIWVSPRGDTKNARMISSNITNLDGFDGLAWTPDGKIVYSSNASGDINLWTMSADGSNPRQITVGKGINMAPSVSPDVRTVVFHSFRTGKPNIWRIDADGGNPRQLSSGDVDFVPLISPDGKWVVYTSQRSGGTGLQKVPIEGGKPIQLNDVTSAYPALSPDGKYIAYYFNDGGVKIGIIPFNGGKPNKVFDTPGGWGCVQWSPDGSALDYVDVRKGVANIWRQPIAGGPPRKVTDFTQDLIWWFAYSHDGKQLALARGAQSSDVVMISNLE